MFGLGNGKKGNRRVYAPRGRTTQEPAPGARKRNEREAQGGKVGVFARFAAWRVSVDWGRARVRMVAVCLALIWGVLWARAWQVQMIEGPELAFKARRQYVASELVTGRRGNILDRNGQVLARSVECRSVYARPAEITDPVRVANTLGPLLRLSPQDIFAQINNTNRKFIWLARKIDDRTAAAVRAADLPGIGFSKEYDRVYPFKQMAGQLLGFVGMDDHGLEGLERSLDKTLAGESRRQLVQRDATGRRFYLHTEGQADPSGEDIRLTLDVQVQYYAEQAIARAVDTYGARWGGVMVVDVPTGDILAWAQYPFFNPNAYRDFAPSQFRNRLASDALEPGSTFKPFLMAAAMQEGKVNRNTLLDCEGGRWQTRTITIRDTSSHGLIPANKVLRYSSNIGMAKIGLQLGSHKFHAYLQKLGFGAHSPVPVADTKGILRIPRNWSEADLISTSFGQSVSVTGLQLTQAYLTLLNNGVYKPLRLVCKADDEQVRQAQPTIFSARVARQVRDMMREVVQEDGSGRAARIEGVQVGGKTGTAQKADRRTGTYGAGRIASFVGFAPVDAPRYLVLAIVDEPARNQYGGVVAAPVFKEVVTRTMLYHGELPEQVLARATPDKAEPTRQECGYKLSRSPRLLLADVEDAAPAQTRHYHTLPGRLTRASAVVPNVVGKTLRNAVEVFARGGIVPVLKGSGERVVRQSPAPGTRWPEGDNGQTYVLWLSEG